MRFGVSEGVERPRDSNSDFVLFSPLDMQFLSNHSFFVQFQHFTTPHVRQCLKTNKCCFYALSPLSLSLSSQSGVELSSVGNGEFFLAIRALGLFSTAFPRRTWQTKRSFSSLFQIIPLSTQTTFTHTCLSSPHNLLFSHFSFLLTPTTTRKLRWRIPIPSTKRFCFSSTSLAFH